MYAVYSVYFMQYGYMHRRRIEIEEKAKAVAVVWGDILECHANHFAGRDDLNKSFCENIHFVHVWTCFNPMSDEFFCLL